jgi:hypothetical protein
MPQIFLMDGEGNSTALPQNNPPHFQGISARKKSGRGSVFDFVEAENKAHAKNVSYQEEEEHPAGSNKFFDNFSLNLPDLNLRSLTREGESSENESDRDSDATPIFRNEFSGGEKNPKAPHRPKSINVPKVPQRKPHEIKSLPLG